MSKKTLSLQAQAKDLGIPLKITIDDRTRYSYCNAHVANLASIEGTQAVYEGQCDNGHTYSMRYEIEEIREKVQIVNGEVSVGQEEGFKAESLEEY